MDTLIDAPPTVVDLAGVSVRKANALVRSAPPGSSFRLDNPAGKHNLVVGLREDVRVTITGPVGYYLAGLSRAGDVTVEGSAGWGVGENLMAGRVHVRGDASQSVAACAHGGLVVVDGNCSLRAGISLKGGTLAVGGSIGPFGAFMAQAGTILVGGDAGPGLGDSLYEAVIYVAGTVKGLGTDAQFEELTQEDVATVAALAAAAGFDHIDPGNVTRIGSARQLYHFSTHHHDAY